MFHEPPVACAVGVDTPGCAPYSLRATGDSTLDAISGKWVELSGFAPNIRVTMTTPVEVALIHLIRRNGLGPGEAESGSIAQAGFDLNGSAAALDRAFDYGEANAAAFDLIAR